MAATNAAVRSALLSVQGLRRRRLGHIGPNHYPRNQLDKWGCKKPHRDSSGSDEDLLRGAAAGCGGRDWGQKRPPPRASLILGGGPSPRRRAAGARGNCVDGAPFTANGTARPSASVHVNGGDGSPQRSVTANRIRVRRGAQNREACPTTNDGIVDGAADPASASRARMGPSSNLVVVLDMDECLIHSQFLSDQHAVQQQSKKPPTETYRQIEDRPNAASLRSEPGERESGCEYGANVNMNSKYSNSPFQRGEEAESIVSTACESFRISLPDGDLVHINKRPNLDLFLKEITAKYETYIFTAAMEVYAAPVLNQLDPTGDMFCGRFYREHCIYDPDLGVYAKDLCLVLRNRTTKDSANGEHKNQNLPTATTDDDNGSHSCAHAICDERRVVLVDNNPLSFLPNPSNGILVSSFYDDPKDDTLEAVMELLTTLDECPDVRPILDQKFGLKKVLSDVARRSGNAGEWR